MIEERTLNCHLYNHPEFAIFYDEDQLLEEDLNWLIASLEAEVANGHRFKEGDIFNIGWMMAKVQSHPDNLLTLSEPDLKEIPINYLHSVTNCLIHQRWQKEILTSYGLTGSSNHPSISQSVLICNHLYKAPEFAMQRLVAKDDDSGWQIVCVDPDHDHQDLTQLERITLYELATTVQAKTIPFLVLPEGSQLVISGKEIFFTLNDEDQHIIEGSFLDTTGYTDLE